MNKKILLCLAVSIASLSFHSQAESSFFSLDANADFKRFSISVGGLHVMPQGKAQAPKITTAVKEGEVAKNGDITLSTVYENLDPSVDQRGLESALRVLGILTGGSLPGALSGSSVVNGISSWTMDGAGMEAEDVTTLGILINYYFNDNISLETKLGIPPKVDIKGVGNITAPFTAVATPNLVGLPLEFLNIKLKNDLQISNLEGHGKVAEARAWTPMWELQYHFGQSGVNKFRPYLGLGLMVAYFNELELTPGLEKDLISAGHKIANMKTGEGGAALAGKLSSANPVIDIDADISFAPIATLGFTYDLNPNWFAVSSISYAHLTGKTTIQVNDAKLGTLFASDVKLQINPIIGYAGIGYRF